MAMTISDIIVIVLQLIDIAIHFKVHYVRFEHLSGNIFVMLCVVAAVVTKINFIRLVAAVAFIGFMVALMLIHGDELTRPDEDDTPLKRQPFPYIVLVLTIGLLVGAFFLDGGSEDAEHLLG